jgi:hypothetical protein
MGIGRTADGNPFDNSSASEPGKCPIIEPAFSWAGETKSVGGDLGETNWGVGGSGGGDLARGWGEELEEDVVGPDLVGAFLIADVLSDGKRPVRSSAALDFFHQLLA